MGLQKDGVSEHNLFKDISSKPEQMWTENLELNCKGTVERYNVNKEIENSSKGFKSQSKFNSDNDTNTMTDRTAYNQDYNSNKSLSAYQKLRAAGLLKTP